MKTKQQTFLSSYDIPGIEDKTKRKKIGPYLQGDRRLAGEEACTQKPSVQLQFRAVGERPHGMCVSSWYRQFAIDMSRRKQSKRLKLPTQIVLF